MPATKPQRPPAGIVLTLPRVADEATQRALDSIGETIRAIQQQIADLNRRVP